MATRLYPNNTAAGVTPSSWSAGWNLTTSAHNVELAGNTSNQISTASFNAPGVSGQYRALVRCVSRPLAAQTISGTIRGTFKALENLTTDNYTIAVAVKVIQSDGSDRGVLLAVTGSDDLANEFVTGTASSKRLMDASENTSITLSSLAVSANDRIVVEVGFREASASTGLGAVTYAENARGDGIPDLDFADGNTVGVPWVEFSQDIKFQEPFFLRALSVPEDVAVDNGGTNSATPITFTTAQVAPARQGDLVVVDQHTRSDENPYAIDNAAGQTWTEELVQNFGTTNYRKRQWCTFDGTWDANLVFSCASPTSYSAQILIFRAAEITDTWEQDVALVETEDTASPFGPAAVTTNADKAIVLASWSSADNNSWSAVSGAGWLDIGSAQYRNLAGTDISDTYAYYWAPTGGTNTGAPTKTQTALGADDTMCLTQAYKRIEGAVALLPSLYTDTDSFFTQTVTAGAVTLTPSLFTDSDAFFTAGVSAGMTPALHTDTDAFFDATVTAGAVTLSPSLFTDGETFFSPTAAPGAVTLAPELVSDSDNFFTQTLQATFNLAPPLYSDTDDFFSATVTAGSVSLEPSLYTDTETFFAATVSVGAVTLLPDLFTDGDTFFNASVGTSYTLAPSLYTDGETFYSATVEGTGGTQTLTPDLYTDGDSFFAATVASIFTLSPELYTDGDSFFSATVTPGAVTLLPSLFDDTDTFFAAAVSASYSLTADLYTDNDSFFSAIVSTGAVTLLPPLYTDVDAFYSASLAEGNVDLLPALYTDADAFHSATITTGVVSLSPALYTDTDEFYSPTANSVYTLSPSLFTDGDTFHDPTVIRGAVTLLPDLFTDGDVFHAATVTGGAINLFPALYTDGETFYSATVSTGTVTLSPTLHDDGDTFFAITLAASYDLVPALYTDADNFYSATVTGGTVTLLPSLFTDDDIFYSPLVQLAGAQNLEPGLVVDSDAFFAPIVTVGGVVQLPHGGAVMLPPAVLRRTHHLRAAGITSGIPIVGNPVLTEIFDTVALDNDFLLMSA